MTIPGRSSVSRVREDRTHGVRREALRRIPNAVGRNSEECSWVAWLTWTGNRKRTHVLVQQGGHGEMLRLVPPDAGRTGSPGRPPDGMNRPGPCRHPVMSAALLLLLVLVILAAEGVGDALVGGVGLAVDPPFLASGNGRTTTRTRPPGDGRPTTGRPSRSARPSRPHTPGPAMPSRSPRSPSPPQGSPDPGPAGRPVPASDPAPACPPAAATGRSPCLPARVAWSHANPAAHVNLNHRSKSIPYDRCVACDRPRGLQAPQEPGHGHDGLPTALPTSNAWTDQVPVSVSPPASGTRSRAKSPLAHHRHLLPRGVNLGTTPSPGRAICPAASASSVNR